VAEQLKTASPTAAQGITLDGQYTVLPERIVENYCFKTINACEAIDIKNNNRSVFAYIVDRAVAPRFRVFSNLKNLKCPFLVRPIHWQSGKTNNGSSHFYVVTNAPGPPVFTGRESEQARWNESDVRDMLIRPAISALLDLQSLGFPHRAITPNNLFYTDINRNAVMLGECFMSPPGWRITPGVETIEMAATEPLAKGEGSFGDDLYNLGAIAIQLLTGQDFSTSAQQADLHARKIMQGSFNALAGSFRFNPTMTEFLKGVLNDELDARLTLSEADSWLNGQKIQTRRGKTVKRSGRGYFFGGKEHFTLPGIVYAMGREPATSVETMQNPSFKNWLKRSMDAEIVNEALKVALSNGRRGGENINVISAFGLTALCPAAPLFYQGSGMQPEGLGPLFIAAGTDMTKRQFCVDILRHRLATNWLKAQPKLQPDWIRLNKILEKLTGFIANPMFGYGFERCVYELNQDSACMSPLVFDAAVRDPADLLPALEKYTQSTSRITSPVDRHIAAFLAAHGDYVTDENLYLLGDSKHPWLAGVAALKILHSVNSKNGNRDYPALCLSMQGVLQPAIDSYHNEKRRERIKNALSEACRTGRLGDVLKIIDDNEERKEDLLEFARARKEFVALGEENKKLKNNIKDLDKSVQRRVDTISPYVAMVFGGLLLAVQS
jgi:hypothetical protein